MWQGLKERVESMKGLYQCWINIHAPAPKAVNAKTEYPTSSGEERARSFFAKTLETAKENVAKKGRKGNVLNEKNSLSEGLTYFFHKRSVIPQKYSQQ